MLTSTASSPKSASAWAIPAGWPEQLEGGRGIEAGHGVLGAIDYYAGNAVRDLEKIDCIPGHSYPQAQHRHAARGGRPDPPPLRSDRDSSLIPASGSSVRSCLNSEGLLRSKISVELTIATLKRQCKGPVHRIVANYYCYFFCIPMTR